MKTLEYKKRFVGNCISGQDRQFIKIDGIEIPLTDDEIMLHRLSSGPCDLSIGFHIDLRQYNMIKENDTVRFEKIE